MLTNNCGFQRKIFALNPKLNIFFNFSSSFYVISSAAFKYNVRK